MPDVTVNPTSLSVSVATASSLPGASAPGTISTQLNYVLNDAANSIEGAGSDSNVWSNLILGGGNSTYPNRILGSTSLRSIVGHYENTIGSSDITDLTDTIDSCIIGGSHNLISSLRINPNTGEPYTSGSPLTHGKIIGGTYCTIRHGDHATLIGGKQNSAIASSSVQYPNGDPSSVPYCAVGMGFGNTVSGYCASVLGGSSNSVLNEFSVISGGTGNIIDGVRNSSADTCGGNIIGGGQSNYISTCVAATIAGGRDNDINSTPTGADQNDSLGSYSFIGGGYLNRISVTVSGLGTRQNSQYGVIGGGYNNRMNNQYAAILGGSSNIATGQYSAIMGGSDNRATASYASAVGADSLADLPYQQTIGHAKFSSNGDCQSSVIVLKATTTNSATPAEMKAGSASLAIRNDTAWSFRALVTGRNAGANESAGYEVKGIIHNDSGTAAIVGTVSTAVLGESDATWDVTADASGATLRIMVTGSATKTIKWSARLEIAEVTS